MSTVHRRIVASAAVGALVVGLAPAALADGWKQLSGYTNATSYPKMSNIDEPTMARFGSEVQVLWSEDTSNGASGYKTAIVNGAGAVVQPAITAVGGWAGVAHNPSLISLGGQRFLVFSGLRSTTTGAPNTSGAAYYATSGDGRTWGVGPGSMSATQSAYAAYSLAGVDNAGTPVWIGSASSTTGLNWHVGISPTDPAPEGSDGIFRLGGCCAYDGAGARDEATGTVWAALFSNSSAATEMGIQVGPIIPFAGSFTQAPGSVTNYDGRPSVSDPGQRVGLVARAGGGVYAAYPIGYPMTKAINLWKVGTDQVLTIPAPDARAVTAAADTDGRIWVTWSSRGKVKAVHTNTAGTALGAAGSFGSPRGSDTVWKSTASAAGGGLDVAYSFTARNAINVWYTHIKRTLSVNAPATAGRGSSVTITVTDAGDPVAGARVTFGGHSATTNAAGKVTLRAPGRSGGAQAKAAKSGYNTGSNAIRIR